MNSSTAVSRYPRSCSRSSKFSVRIKALKASSSASSSASLEKVAAILKASPLVVGPGIEGLADAVAEEVEAEDGEEDRHPREEGHPPGRREVGLGLEEHRAPARLPGLRSEAEVRQGSLGDYGVAHRERRLYQQRRQGVRQDVVGHDPDVASADGPGSLHVVEAPDGESL